MAKPDFTPLEDDAKRLLSEATGIDYTGTGMRDWFCVTARFDDGEIRGVLACEPKNAFDWHFNIALPDPSCLSPKLLRTVFSTLFSRGVRVSALIEADNEHANDQAVKFGFVYEGFLRRGYDGTRDANLYGMLSEDCIWLVDPKHHRALRNGVYNGLPA